MPEPIVRQGDSQVEDNTLKNPAPCPGLSPLKVVGQGDVRDSSDGLAMISEAQEANHSEGYLPPKQSSGCRRRTQE